MKFSRKTYSYSAPPEITPREEIALILAKWNLELYGTISEEKVSILYEENFGKRLTISEISDVLEELYWEDQADLFEQADSDREIPLHLI